MLVFGKFSAQSAQALRLNTEVIGNQIIGYPLPNVGIGSLEVKIPLRAGLFHRGEDPILQGNECIGQLNPEKSLKFRHLLVQYFQIILMNSKQLAVLYAFYV